MKHVLTPCLVGYVLLCLLTSRYPYVQNVLIQKKKGKFVLWFSDSWYMNKTPYKLEAATIWLSWFVVGVYFGVTFIRLTYTGIRLSAGLRGASVLFTSIFLKEVWYDSRILEPIFCVGYIQCCRRDGARTPEGISTVVMGDVLFSFFLSFF